MAKKVLIVEDASTSAAIVKDLLQKEGLEVDVAQTGEEGLLKAARMEPDLVVLDLMLPDIDGFEVCAQLRKEPKLSKTLVVVLSAKDKLQDITKAFYVGADDYIIKPPVPEFLIKKIRLYLRIC